MRAAAIPLTLVTLAGAAWLTGCAARGGTPRPFPTPSSPAPVEAADPAGSPPDAGPSEATSVLARHVVDLALRLVGTPYRAGGGTPASGFDCSGLVAWVFGEVGLQVPRTVRDQFSAGVPVAGPAGGQPGDLLFFDTGRAGEPTHVALAIGDGRFVHAPSSRGVVRVEPLTAEYWSRRYVGARRLVVEGGDR